MLIQPRSNSQNILCGVDVFEISIWQLHAYIEKRHGNDQCLRRQRKVAGVAERASSLHATSGCTRPSLGVPPYNEEHKPKDNGLGMPPYNEEHKLEDISNVCMIHGNHTARYGS